MVSAAGNSGSSYKIPSTILSFLVVSKSFFGGMCKFGMGDLELVGDKRGFAPSTSGPAPGPEFDSSIGRRLLVLFGLVQFDMTSDGNLLILLVVFIDLLKSKSDENPT